MKLDKVIDISDTPKNALFDGVYHAKFPDGFIYRVEKRGDKWIMADGTGCKEHEQPLHPEETFIPIRFYPSISIPSQLKESSNAGTQRN